MGKRHRTSADIVLFVCGIIGRQQTPANASLADGMQGVRSSNLLTSTTELLEKSRSSTLTMGHRDFPNTGSANPSANIRRRINATGGRERTSIYSDTRRRSFHRICIDRSQQHQSTYSHARQCYRSKRISDCSGSDFDSRITRRHSFPPSVTLPRSPRHHPRALLSPVVSNGGSLSNRGRFRV